MKKYLVGGAVRDQLLNYPVKERDWVVVGSTPQQMLQQGYQQVGRDFPVFLHPQTGEEYALARTERKSAPGYYGFLCDFNPQVTLEEDLARRDLTINAMAMDEQGQLIDPYHGQEDLRDGILRHVSPAFVEDPVRVLRIARFAARYHHLGFKVAEDTRRLMYDMVRRGELNHLVSERVCQELQRSLEERNPELFITTLRSCGALAIVLPEIDQLFGIPNSRHYHPEVDSGIHTLMALESAVKLTRDPMLRFAALVHDLGKGVTPKNEWPKHHGHEERGVKIIDILCERLRIPADWRKFSTMVSRFHLTIHRLFELKSTTIVKVLEQTDAFRRPELFKGLLIVCETDYRACGKTDPYRQREQWEYIREQTANISAKPFVEEGLKGEAIKNKLHQQRVNCVDQLIKS